MIYYILKPFIYTAFRIFFRKVRFSNRDSIPKDRAILFAVNHPSAFLDSILVAAYIWPVTHFLSRGDIFASPIIRWLLSQIHSIPIFRARDGYANLKHNQKTFDRVYKILNKGKHLLVMAEGQTIYEKRLRPIQKGTGRIMVDFHSLYPDAKLCVLPIGVSFTDSIEFRSEVMATVGKPLLLEDYVSVIEENPRKAVKQITDEITRQLKELVVHIDDDEDAPFINRILDFHRNNQERFLLPAFTTNGTLQKEEVAIANQLNVKSEAEKIDLRNKVKAYDAALKKNNLEDIGLARPGFFNILNSFLLILGLPVFLIGFLHNWPFLTLGKTIADAKVSRPAFHSSVRFGFIVIPHFFVFLIAFIILLYNGSWWWLVILCLLPLAGFISFTYGDLFFRWNAARKWNAVDTGVKEELIEMRKEIFERFSL